MLVHTTTSRVPGNGRWERVVFMRNLICQHHWNRDFDWDQDRWHSQAMNSAMKTAFFTSLSSMAASPCSRRLFGIKALGNPVRKPLNDCHQNNRKVSSPHAALVASVFLSHYICGKYHTLVEESHKGPNRLDVVHKPRYVAVRKGLGDHHSMYRRIPQFLRL